MAGTPVPLTTVEGRALAQMARDESLRGRVVELRISHDDWCMSQRAASSGWCNCVPDVGAYDLTAKTLVRIVAERRRRDQGRDD